MRCKADSVVTWKHMDSVHESITEKATWHPRVKYRPLKQAVYIQEGVISNRSSRCHNARRCAVCAGSVYGNGKGIWGYQYC